ncbi:hypothetical protein TrCOL_g1692 [Triparma columacea]|uniref:Thiamin pyrophosphokinase thiamin-binding domain-containing protein n=1 Tax=Triparma columacea TaxID=722753 RepID=A0A9W7GL42_9STRA|nr:hypothetical protein TrCOL_g1692 [Triparma columacea]
MPPMLTHLFALSSYVICADGGANRLHDLCALPHSPGEESKSAVRHLPDAVKGDMDSIRPDVRGYYESRGVGIIEDGSVDLNDLEKCLWQVKEVQEGGAGMFDAVCIYGGWGGRFDQSMSSLSSLFKFMDIFRHTILVDEETTVTLLKPCEGDSAHVIRPAANVEGKLCGLIPVFGPCSDVTTDGLRWNLKGDELCFGRLVSSSNEYSPGKDVVVRCNNFLAWTTQISLRNGGT